MPQKILLRFRSVFLENYYLFEDKEYFCYVKQHLKSCTTAETYTFQNGGYFNLNKFILALFLFHKMFSLSILNYFVDFKKIISSQINVIVNNHIFLI